MLGIKSLVYFDVILNIAEYIGSEIHIIIIVDFSRVNIDFT